VSKYAGLKARLERLEAKSRSRRGPPRLRFAIMDLDDAVIGISGPQGAICERRVGEGLPALISRSAVALSDPPVSWAVYAPDPVPIAPTFVGILEPKPRTMADFAGIGIVGPGKLVEPGQSPLADWLADKRISKSD
jgi:hypothetical protein